MKCIVRLILFLLLTINSFAEMSISIPDTTIPRGIICSLPVHGSFDTAPSTSLELIFEFDPYVIDVKSIDTSDSSILGNSEYSINIDLSIMPAIIRIKFDKINSNQTNGVLFYLNIEGLAGPRELTDVVCKEVKIDGKTVEFITSRSRVNVIGSTVVQKYPEGLFQNFPNPFRGASTFQFNLQSDSKVKFELFNLAGVKVYDYVDLCKYIKISNVSKTDGPNEISDLFAELPTGKYYLNFEADDAFFASGTYFLTMKTGNNFFTHSFLYVK